MITKSRFNLSLAPIAVASALALALVAPAAHAGSDPAATGRDLAARYDSSIVTVKTVVQQTMGARKGESRNTTGGVIVDKTGMTMISLSSIDPSALLKQMYAGRIPEGTDLTAEVTDIKIVLGDQTEVDAEVVLRDPDLDIAIIRPSSAFTATVTPIDISGNAKADILDKVIVAKRLDQKADNALGVAVVQIGAVVKKPRLFYLIGDSTPMANLGSPVFTTGGALLGVMVMRTGASDAGGDRGVLGIVIPAANIRDNVDQAREIPPAKKEEKPAE
jgi:S1-C subfamily serine protease